MKKLSYLFISSMIASSFALAEVWEYTPGLDEENTKEELVFANTTYSIDTSNGELSITG